MTDQPKYATQFSGTFTNAQFGVGDGVSLTMHAGAAAARLDAAQLEALRGAIAELEADVRRRAPDDRRDEALAEVRAIGEATIAADEVDVPRLRRVLRWFASNAPELAQAVTGVLFGPAVGALVGGAGGFAAALLGGEEEPRADRS
jgi:hypothetical protein